MQANRCPNCKELLSYGLRINLQKLKAMKRLLKSWWDSSHIKADVSVEDEFVNAIKTIIDSDGELAI